jgi:hypothetical protein
MPQYNPRPLQAAKPANPSFVAPAQAASQDELIAEETIDMDDEYSSGHKPKKQRRSFKEWLKSRTKKQWILIICILVLLLGGAGAGAYFLFLKKDKAPVVSNVVKKKKPAVVAPTTVPSTLTGLDVDPAVNKRPVTAVMIENSEDARPQSGLDYAGVVFEAVAEGGITRFVTLFQDTQPTYIGPVRSVRPYYIQWAMGFDAAIAHVGGSGEALQDLKDWNTKNLDQFVNGQYFHRITSRVAPHNVYTSMSELNQIETNNGYGEPSFTGFVRKKEAPAKTPNATSIDVNISGPAYNSHYDYDATTNRYKRSEGGQPHNVIDQNGTASQLTPKVVVLLTMPQSLMADHIHTVYNTLGTGHAYIFQDGTVTEGNWKKSSRQENFTFTDNNGRVIGLNPGQTWVTVVGDTSYVTYK